MRDSIFRRFRRSSRDRQSCLTFGTGFRLRYAHPPEVSMSNGFLVRVAAQADKAARDLHDHADDMLDEGLLTQASILRSVAAALARLAFDAARDPDGLPLDQVADDTAEAHKAIRQVADAVDGLVKPDLVRKILQVDVVCRRLNADVLSETQPITLPVSRPNGRDEDKD